MGVPSARLLAVNPVAHPGGAETTLLRLLPRLERHGWRVTATTPDSGLLADLIVEGGLAWQPLPCGGLGTQLKLEPVWTPKSQGLHPVIAHKIISEKENQRIVLAPPSKIRGGGLYEAIECIITAE